MELRRDVTEATLIGGHQAGALGYLEDGQRRLYLLVTSRRLGRWIFPKGGVAARETWPAAAARELREEAGAIGLPRSAPVGRYAAVKRTDAGFAALTVTLYPVRVHQMLRRWQEDGLRKRRLADAAEACELVATPEMAELLAAFERSLGPVTLRRGWAG